MKISDTEFYKAMRAHDVWVMEEPLIGEGIIGRTSGFCYYPGEPGDPEELFYFGFVPDDKVDLDSGAATMYFSPAQVESAQKIGDERYRISGEYDGCSSPRFSQAEPNTIVLRFCRLG